MLRKTWAEASHRERAGWVWFVGLMLGFFPLVLFRTVTGRGSDFVGFYEAGRYVLEHGTRQPGTSLFRYWPSVDAAWAAVAWLPLPLVAFAWCLVGYLTWLGLLRAINCYLLDDAQQTLHQRVTLGTGLLVLPLALDHFCLGAFHILMVWLMVAGLGRAARGRSWSGGVLLGLAIWLKLLPVGGAAYLLWKRKWLPAAVAVACAVLLDVGISQVAYGPQTAWQLHQEWWHHDGAGSGNRILDEVGSVDEDRLSNQSLAVVMRRLLTHMGCEPGGVRERVAMANLSPSQLKVAYMSVAALLALAIMIVCRRPAWATSRSQWSTEISLLLLATLWFSPVVWSYHPTAAAPALAVVLNRTLMRPWLRAAVVGLWLAAMVLLCWQLPRGFGEFLWMNLLLGAMLIWTAPHGEP